MTNSAGGPSRSRTAEGQSFCWGCLRPPVPGGSLDVSSSCQPFFLTGPFFWPTGRVAVVCEVSHIVASDPACRGLVADRICGGFFSVPTRRLVDCGIGWLCDSVQRDSGILSSASWGRHSQRGFFWLVDWWIHHGDGLRLFRRRFDLASDRRRLFDRGDNGVIFPPPGRFALTSSPVSQPPARAPGPESPAPPR